MNNSEIMKAVIELSDETRAILKVIRKQKKVNNDLKAAYMKLNQIFNTAMDAVMVVAKDHTVLRINDSMAKMSGLTREELEGRHCYEVFGGENCLTSNCPLDRIYRGEERLEMETKKKLRDGSIINCLVTATPLKDSDGHLTGIVKTFKDISARKQAEKRMNYLAHHDHLTGLPNRMCFLDRLGLEIAHAKRNKKLLAVMFLDLDGFKAVNDTLGHHAGDLLLKDVASRLVSVARESDTVARIGGDEFAVLLSGLDRQKDAAVFAKRLTAAFDKPWQQDGHEYQLSASIGITLYPGDGENPYTLLNKADQAMYRAKKKGSVFQFFNYYLNKH